MTVALIRRAWWLQDSSVLQSTTETFITFLVFLADFLIFLVVVYCSPFYCNNVPANLASYAKKLLGLRKNYIYGK